MLLEQVEPNNIHVFDSESRVAQLLLSHSAATA
jgi:hypothetical protein